MHRKKHTVGFLSVFVFLALITTAMAGDISGKWRVPGPINISVAFVFKVDGTTLTGTLSVRPSEAIEIKGGKIKGNKLSFYVERTMRQKLVKVRFKGTVVGDEIQLTRDVDGTKTDMTAKRESSDSPTTKPDSSNKI